VGWDWGNIKARRRRRERLAFETVQLGEDVTLYRGDCLKVMAGMEPGSVDAVVTDPPYNVGKP